MNRFTFRLLKIACALAIFVAALLCNLPISELQASHKVDDLLQYIYDSQNRLVEVRYSDKIIRYTYDDAGNRTGMTVEILVASPAIASITPRGAVAGGSGSILRILGSNFSPSSVVKWNGIYRATLFVTPTELRITLTSNDLSAAETASVIVVNPTPTFAPSNAAIFSIVQQAALSGRVTSAGNGLAGVTVTLSGTEPDATVTDANGFYNFAIVQNGNYAITPSFSGYTFDPPNRNTIYSGFAQSNLDFSGTAVNTTPVTISGRVIGYNGFPARVAMVSLTDSQGNVQWAVVNMLGNYRFTNVARGGSYTLKVSNKGTLTYTPITFQANDNMSNLDFNPNP